MIDDLLDRLAEARHRDGHWMQVDMAAPGLPASAVAAVAERLAQSVGTGGMTGRWWFVRKEPGVRIRQERRESGPLSSTTVAAVAALGSATLSVYEAESHRFGGADGMEIAHDLFTFDSALAVIRERTEVAPLRWSAWVLGDLAGRLTDDGAEEWDAWKRLDAMLESVAGTGTGSPVSDPVAGADAIPPGLAETLARGHGIVERRLRATPLEGIGRRSWFGTAAVFHWNRLGFSPTAMRTVVTDALRGIEQR